MSDTKTDNDGQTDALKSVFKKTEEFAKFQGMLIELAQKLKPVQVRFANMVISGKSPTEAYRIAKGGECSDNTAYNQGRKWMQNETLKHYIDKANEFAVLSTMAKAEYSEEDWLRTQTEILHKAMGEREVKKVVTYDGTAFEVDLKEDNLGQANKAQELLAKRFGWLTDNQNLKLSGRATLNMVRKDLTGAKKVKAKKLDESNKAKE